MADKQFKDFTEKTVIEYGDIILLQESGGSYKKYKFYPYYNNYIINGGFDIWQRNTSFTGGGQYSADRWLAHSGQANANLVAERSTDVPPNGLSKYSLCLYAPSGNYNQVQQRIESSNTKNLTGKTLTLSFWLKCAESSPSVNVLFSIPASAADVYTSDFTVLGIIATAPTTWTQYSYTFTATSTMAKRGFAINISRPNTANNTMYITQCMLNEGSVAQAFTPFGGSYISDYQACLRYYEKSYFQEIFPDTVVDINSSSVFKSQATTAYWLQMTHIPFIAAKRVPPTITYYSPTTTEPGKWRNVSAGADVGVSNTAISTCQNFSTTQNNILITGNDYRFLWTADAEI